MMAIQSLRTDLSFTVKKDMGEKKVERMGNKKEFTKPLDVMKQL